MADLGTGASAPGTAAPPDGDSIPSGGIGVYMTKNNAIKKLKQKSRKEGADQCFATSKDGKQQFGGGSYNQKGSSGFGFPPVPVSLIVRFDPPPLLNGRLIQQGVYENEQNRAHPSTAELGTGAPAPGTAAPDGDLIPNGGIGVYMTKNALKKPEQKSRKEGADQFFAASKGGKQQFGGGSYSQNDAYYNNGGGGSSWGPYHGTGNAGAPFDGRLGRSKDIGLQDPGDIMKTLEKIAIEYKNLFTTKLAADDEEEDKNHYNGYDANDDHDDLPAKVDEAGSPVLEVDYNKNHPESFPRMWGKAARSAFDDLFPTADQPGRTQPSLVSGSSLGGAAAVEGASPRTAGVLDANQFFDDDFADWGDRKSAAAAAAASSGKAAFVKCEIEGNDLAAGWEVGGLQKMSDAGRISARFFLRLDDVRRKK